MTGTVSNPTVRRVAVLAGATAVFATSTALLAGPASAKVPVGWGPTYDVDPLFVLGVLVGVPILLFVLITAAVYLPGVARGERVAPGATGPQDQWLGGRRTAGEIEFTPAAESESILTEDAEAAEAQPEGEPVRRDGGASARW